MYFTAAYLIYAGLLNTSSILICEKTHTCICLLLKWLGLISLVCAWVSDKDRACVCKVLNWFSKLLTSLWKQFIIKFLYLSLSLCLSYYYEGKMYTGKYTGWICIHHTESWIKFISVWKAVLVAVCNIYSNDLTASHTYDCCIGIRGRTRLNCIATNVLCSFRWFLERKFVKFGSYKNDW